jgi:hypothetical protein
MRYQAPFKLFTRNVSRGRQIHVELERRFAQFMPDVIAFARNA